MRFSVIIPVYNVADYVSVALDSLLLQDFADWEAICVDDGSTDGSDRVLDQYANRDARIKVIHSENAGVSAARNRAMQLAIGEYLVFLDADDALSVNAFEVLNATIAGSKADIVRYGAIDSEKINIKRKVDDSLVSKQIISCETDNGLREVAYRTLGSQIAWNACVKRDIVKDLVFEDIPNGEDILWGVECMMRATTYCFTNAPLYTYRHRQGSAMSASLRHINSSLTMLALLTEKLSKWNRIDAIRGIAIKRIRSMWLIYVPTIMSKLSIEEKGLSQKRLMITGRKIVFGNDLMPHYFKLYCRLALMNFYTFYVLLLLPFTMIVKGRNKIMTMIMH